MNALQRIIAGLILAVPIITGCTTVPVYDDYGRYQGSTPEVNIGKIAGAVTGAAIGGAAGMALGDPVSGFFFGAAAGGAIRPSEPIYRGGGRNSHPADRQYRAEYFMEKGYSGYPSSQVEWYSSQGNRNQMFKEQQPKVSLSCEEQYDARMRTAERSHELKSRRIEQFRIDTQDLSAYSSLKKNLEDWYPKERQMAKNAYATCLGNQ